MSSFCKSNWSYALCWKKIYCLFLIKLPGINKYQIMIKENKLILSRRRMHTNTTTSTWGWLSDTNSFQIRQHHLLKKIYRLGDEQLGWDDEYEMPINQCNIYTHFVVKNLNKILTKNPILKWLSIFLKEWPTGNNNLN